MICPECNGVGETVYHVVTGRDENKITVEKRKDICRTCRGIGKVKMTNADRIRAMSDEAMAEKLQYASGCPVNADCIKMSGDCKACWLDWLKQPVEEEI